MLVYIYYAFDNRPAWFRAIWKGSDLVRFVLEQPATANRLAYLISGTGGLAENALSNFARSALGKSETAM